MKDELNNELVQLGNYPSKLRKVGISNGSGIGNMNNSGYYDSYQGFNAGAELYTWGETEIIDGITLLTNAKIFAASGKLIPGIPATAITPAIEACHRDLELDIKASAGVLFLEVEKANDGSCGNKTFAEVDHVPGGFRNFFSELTAAIKTQNALQSINNPFPNACFIPTISALDLNTSSALDLNTSNYFYPYIIYIPGYPWPKNNINTFYNNVTPFDAIYANINYPYENTGHVTLNSKISAFFHEEVNPVNLYLQNQTINDNDLFEARNSITIGYDVDPVLSYNHQLPRTYKGPVIFEPTANVKIIAGTNVIIEDGVTIEGEVEIGTRVYCLSSFGYGGRKARTNPIESIVNAGLDSASLDMLEVDKNLQNTVIQYDDIDEKNPEFQLFNNYENQYSVSFFV